jgi:hypothetical protein
MADKRSNAGMVAKIPNELLAMNFLLFMFGLYIVQFTQITSE